MSPWLSSPESPDQKRRPGALEIPRLKRYRSLLAMINAPANRMRKMTEPSPVAQEGRQSQTPPGDVPREVSAFKSLDIFPSTENRTSPVSGWHCKTWDIPRYRFPVNPFRDIPRFKSTKCMVSQEHYHEDSHLINRIVTQQSANTGFGHCAMLWGWVRNYNNSMIEDRPNLQSTSIYPWAILTQTQTHTFHMSVPRNRCPATKPFLFFSLFLKTTPPPSGTEPSRKEWDPLVSHLWSFLSHMVNICQRGDCSPLLVPWRLQLHTQYISIWVWINTY